MTKVYRGLGLSCLYPENWTLTEDTIDDQTIGFTLESPTTAFMMVNVYPWTIAPSQAIEQAREAMQVEYDDIEYEPIPPDITIKGHVIEDSRAGEVRFYYLDLLVVSRLIAFAFNRQTFLIQFQAEDRDFATLDQVFRAMTISILNSFD